MNYCKLTIEHMIIMRDLFFLFLFLFLVFKIIKPIRGKTVPYRTSHAFFFSRDDKLHILEFRISEAGVT